MVKPCRHSIQIGDLAIRGYEELKQLRWKDHKFFGGNHDNYDVYNLSPHSLGDYGLFNLAGFRMYFIRGAFSIDWKQSAKAERRGKNKMWWEEEQLRNHELENAVQRLLHHVAPIP